jgi:endonuclease/exonuclease/phosphatase family metal-dependent hydrolase
MNWHKPLLVALGLLALSGQAQDTFTIATYNVENYLLTATQTRQPKPPESRAKVVENILAMKPDVIAFEEMGATNAFFELKAALKKGGLDYPHWEHVRGWDTNIHVAVLSRFPITARRPHTNGSYLLGGRRLHVSRGFAEVDIKVNDGYSFTLFVAHLKSRRPVPEADEGEMREQEATILREIIDARLKANPNANLVVAGDLNDVKDSKSTRALIGRGKVALTDTRPAERNGDNLPAERPTWDPRNVTWTHFYGKEDSYSRIDYILISQGMTKEWDKAGTYIFTAPNWGLASDHRPIVARFRAKDE